MTKAHPLLSMTSLALCAAAFTPAAEAADTQDPKIDPQKFTSKITHLRQGEGRKLLELHGILEWTPSEPDAKAHKCHSPEAGGVVLEEEMPDNVRVEPIDLKHLRFSDPAERFWRRAT